jgi:hypothetical protein
MPKTGMLWLWRIIRLSSYILGLVGCWVVVGASLTVWSNTCHLRFKVDSATGNTSEQTTKDSSNSSSFGPQRDDKAQASVHDFNDFSDDSSDYSSDDSFDEDSKWALDNPSAKRDTQDLKVFRRVHILEAHKYESHRNYVYLDISVGKNAVGKIIIELVWSCDSESIRTVLTRRFLKFSDSNDLE